MLINKILSNILLNSLIVYVLIKYLKFGITINNPYMLNCEIVFVLGALFWLIYDLAVRIVKFFTFPLTWLLGPIFALFLNILAIYIFVYIVNNLNLGINLHITSITGALVISFIVSILNLFFKKI